MFQPSYYATWIVVVRTKCIGKTPDGVELERSERSTYVVNRKSTLSGMLDWVRQTERAKYATLGWTGLDGEIELEALGPVGVNFDDTVLKGQ